MPRYRYEIEPRTEAVGGGWRLKLFEDDTEVDGGVFPADRHVNPHRGMAWFNGLPEQERARWLEKAGTGRAVDAWVEFLSDQAYIDAQCEGEERVASRK